MCLSLCVLLTSVCVWVLCWTIKLKTKRRIIFFPLKTAQLSINLSHRFFCGADFVMFTVCFGACGLLLRGTFSTFEHLFWVGGLCFWSKVDGYWWFIDFKVFWRFMTAYAGFFAILFNEWDWWVDDIYVIEKCAKPWETYQNDVVCSLFNSSPMIISFSKNIHRFYLEWLWPIISVFSNKLFPSDRTNESCHRSITHSPNINTPKIKEKRNRVFKIE